MEPTASQLMAEVQALRRDTDAARNEALTVDVIGEAVSEGIRIAVSDPDVWAAALEAMQMHAKAEAGGWLFGGIKALISKLAWILVIGTGVYLVGGWAALVALFKAGHQ